MSNVGSTVSGFAEGSSDMSKFDRLPERARQALNYARGEWSIDYFAQWVGFFGPDVVCSMIEKSDDEWTRTAYRERGFEAKDISFFTTRPK